MFDLFRKPGSSSQSAARKRSSRPLLEGLEDRMLLYSTLGAQWTYGARITYSFVPDGTNIGGVSSSLFQTLNAKYSTATWQFQFQKAAAVWQNITNINIAQVSDDGSPLGADGYQQDDPRFGDIRFSAIPLSSGTLASCFLPPPINGGSDAGDIVFNTGINWQINSTYDLETVAIHEIGHALGMSHSAITTACMYAYYNGQKQQLTSDDTSGLQSVYGSRQYDRFNSGGLSNAVYTRATNVTPYIDANAQVALPGLDMTTLGQSAWYQVTVPATTTGTMVVTAQAGNLSLLSPRLAVYSSSLTQIGLASTTDFGGTVSLSFGGVQPGQTYYIRVAAASGGNAYGAYGLELNFGSLSQPPISPPNTIVIQQPDKGGGSAMNLLQGLISSVVPTSFKPELVQIGSYSGWGETLTLPSVQAVKPTIVSSATTTSNSATQIASAVASYAVSSSTISVTSQGVAMTVVISTSATSALTSSTVLGSTPTTLVAVDSALDGWDG